MTKRLSFTTKSEAKMRYMRAVLAAAIVLFGCSSGPSELDETQSAGGVRQERDAISSGVTAQTVYEDQHDISAPLRDMVRAAAAAAPLEAPPLEERLEVGPLHRRPPPVVHPGPDPVRQLPREDDPSVTGSFAVVNGISYTGWIPPDANASVGATQIVQTVNAHFQIFDKSTGRSLLGPSPITSLWAGFKGVCETNAKGDPIVLYDKAAGRWLITQLATANGTYAECIAVSASSDATGAFNRYAYYFSAFNDFPKFGVWHDAYYASYNMQSPSNAVQVCAYDRASMLQGRRANDPICFQRPPEEYYLLPSDLDGSTPPPAGSPNYFVGLPWGSYDHIQLYKFHVDFATRSNSYVSGPVYIPVAPFSAATELIPQLGTTQMVDAYQNVLTYRLAYRNFGDHESLVTSHSVDVGSTTGIRWYELRSPNTTPVVYQQGTYSPDLNYRWMPSMAMDGAGNIALGYSVSSSTMYPSIRYTGRYATDPLGVMAAETSIIEGGGAQDVCISCSRWGDYSSMAVDPTDDRTFVYTNQYYATTSAGGWSTRIAKFKLNPWTPTGSLATARQWHTTTLLPNGKVLVTGGTDVAGATLASAELYDPATGAFTAAGTMAFARYNHSATLLPNGKVLIAGGYGVSGYLASAELYDPATGTFTGTGSLGTARNGHKATLVPNGKVLIAGGVNTTPYLASAELYDPAAGTFTFTGSMTTSRSGHTLTLLPSGKVLVTGGRGSLGYLASAELYDPAAGTFAATASMAAVRHWHTATLLPNGKVMVVGGYSPTSGYLATAEVYDAATGIFAATGSMATPRNYHRATLLPNGKVLVAGGYDGTSIVATAEQYDPASGTFASARSMGTTREHHGAVLLPNGKVLEVGGWDDVAGGPVASAELYDAGYPENLGAFTSTGGMTTARNYHTATVLPSGKVLVAGGSTASGNLSTAEVYDAATGSFSSTGNMAFARSQHTATALPTGKVLVAGGNGVSAELCDAGTGTFSATGNMVANRTQHTATLLPNGKVLIAAGWGIGYGPRASAELYDPATGTFSTTGNLFAARYNHTATLLPNGKVLIAGGYGVSSTILASAELYDPATGMFAQTGSMAVGRYGHSAALLPNGKVLIAGGSGSSGYLASAHLYDPAAGTFTTTGSLGAARSNHTATLLPNGKVLIAAGSNNLASAELYDPATGTFYANGGLVTFRQFHAAALLPTGKVLVVGGFQNTYPAVTFLSSAELYQ